MTAERRTIRVTRRNLMRVGTVTIAADAVAHLPTFASPVQVAANAGQIEPNHARG